MILVASTQNIANQTTDKGAAAVVQRDEEGQRT